MNVTQAAQQLSVAPSTVRARLRGGALRGRKHNGRWVLDAAGVQRAASAPVPGSEIGFHGTTIWDGLVRDDYNANLRHPASIGIYEKMRRSDAQVQAIETVISLPIRTVRFYVEPGDDSHASAEAAELIERNLILGQGMSMTFDDLLRKALISVMLGFQVFEKVWIAEDGYVRFRKFADRHPRTVFKWQFDEAGGVAGIIQHGTDAQGKRREETIPIANLLRFSYREEWGNPEGFALCRVLYKHWYIKDSLYRIANIGAERDWVGTPVGTVPFNASDEDQAKYLNALKKLTSHEEGALVLREGYALDSYQGGGKSDALMAYIEHHDALMARAALAQFLNLVGAKQGGKALSEDQSQFFLLCEETIATWLCSIINQFAIHQLIDWNFPGIPVYPRLMHAHIGTVVQPVGIAHALAALVNKNLISPGGDIENAVRDMMNLPEIPEDQLQQTREESNDSAVAPAAEAVTADTRPIARAAAPDIVHATDIVTRARQAVDAAEHTLITEGRELQEKQLAGFEKRATVIVDAAIQGTPSARAAAYKALAALEIPFRSEYETWLRLLLMEVVRGGLQAAAEETNMDVPPIPAELRSYVGVQAQMLADKHRTDLRFVAVARLQRDIDAGLGRDRVMWNVRQVLRDRVTMNLARSLDDAIRAVADQVSAAIPAAISTATIAHAPATSATHLP